MAPNDIEIPYNIWGGNINKLIKEQESNIIKMTSLNNEFTQPSLGVRQYLIKYQSTWSHFGFEPGPSSRTE